MQKAVQIVESRIKELEQVVLGFGGLVWNAVKLASCDFESNYKCEVIHGAGLVVPPLSLVTVWFADDGK